MASSINASTSGAGGVITSADNSGILNLQSGGNTIATVQSTGFSLPASATINAANTFGFENRIINGGMTIDQRNNGASVATTATGTIAYTVDRFAYVVSQASKFTVQQNAGAVTPPAGFINYLGMTSTSAYSVLSADYFLIRQPIEGLNIADLGWGTANAKTVTLSFWVRSSLTGTFGGSLTNSAQVRSYPYSYTISAANTWEQKSITIPGDTTGTWLTTNAAGIYLNFSLGSGSSISGTAGAWVATTMTSVTGAVSVVGTNGATLYITGVQLEVGSQATSFDFRSIGQETALCQRYYTNGAYFNGFSESTTSFCMSPTLPVAMRAIPTASLSSILVIYDGASNISQSVANAGTFAGSTRGGMLFSVGNFSGLVDKRPGSMNPVSSTGTYAFSAEL